ncbi:hypothetical protein HK102_003245 [Quaeritorhiza haematococci]|nr:hypothetical protein HK102_003245 [Quaeritorhiza haematococci]
MRASSFKGRLEQHKKPHCPLVRLEQRRWKRVQKYFMEVYSSRKKIIDRNRRRSLLDVDMMCGDEIPETGSIEPLLQASSTAPRTVSTSSAPPTSTTITMDSAESLDINAPTHQNLQVVGAVLECGAGANAFVASAATTASHATDGIRVQRDAPSYPTLEASRPCTTPHTHAVKTKSTLAMAALSYPSPITPHESFNRHIGPPGCGLLPPDGNPPVQKSPSIAPAQQKFVKVRTQLPATPICTPKHDSFSALDASGARSQSNESNVIKNHAAISPFGGLSSSSTPSNTAFLPKSTSFAVNPRKCYGYIGKKQMAAPTPVEWTPTPLPRATGDTTGAGSQSGVMDIRAGHISCFDGLIASAASWASNAPQASAPLTSVLGNRNIFAVEEVQRSLSEAIAATVQQQQESRSPAFTKRLQVYRKCQFLSSAAERREKKVQKFIFERRVKRNQIHHLNRGYWVCGLGNGKKANLGNAFNITEGHDRRRDKDLKQGSPPPSPAQILLKTHALDPSSVKRAVFVTIRGDAEVESIAIPGI